MKTQNRMTVSKQFDSIENDQRMSVNFLFFNRKTNFLFFFQKSMTRSQIEEGEKWKHQKKGKKKEMWYGTREVKPVKERTLV